jgi:hypothetical protein
MLPFGHIAHQYIKKRYAEIEDEETRNESVFHAPYRIERIQKIYDIRVSISTQPESTEYAYLIKQNL